MGDVGCGDVLLVGPWKRGDVFKASASSASSSHVEDHVEVGKWFCRDVVDLFTFSRQQRL